MPITMRIIRCSSFFRLAAMRLFFLDVAMQIRFLYSNPKYDFPDKLSKPVLLFVKFDNAFIGHNIPLPEYLF